jgi:hypothetical protein
MASFPRLLLALSLVPVAAGCGVVKVNGKDPFGSTSTSSATESASPSLGGGELEPESKLTARFCSELAKRSAPVMARIDGASKETDPRKQFAAYGQALKAAREIELGLQAEFDAAYKRASDAASKKNVASTPGWGYGTTNNANYLQLSEATIAAIAGGAAAAAKTGMPFATDLERGIKAGDVNPMGNSACTTPRRTELLRELEATKKQLPKHYRLGAQLGEEDLPVKPQDLVAIEGGLATAGESPVIRAEGGRPIMGNCRATNRFSHWDSTGHARYEEDCDRVGGRGVVLQVTVKKATRLVPPEAGTLATGDYLGVVARVISTKKAVSKKGDVTTTTHTVEVEPLVVTKVGRKNASTLAYQF